MAALTPGDRAALRKLDEDSKPGFHVGRMRFDSGSMSYGDGTVREFVEGFGHTGGFEWGPAPYGDGGRILRLLNWVDPDGEF